MIHRWTFWCDKATISVTRRTAPQLVIERHEHGSEPGEQVTLAGDDELVALYFALKQLVDNAPR